MLSGRLIHVYSLSALSIPTVCRYGNRADFICIRPSVMSDPLHPHSSFLFRAAAAASPLPHHFGTDSGIEMLRASKQISVLFYSVNYSRVDAINDKLLYSILKVEIRHQRAADFTPAPIFTTRSSDFVHNYLIASSWPFSVNWCDCLESKHANKSSDGCC